jgi:hypothetical protein
MDKHGIKLTRAFLLPSAENTPNTQENYNRHKYNDFIYIEIVEK